MYCIRCGKEMEEGALHCVHCGAAVAGEQPAPEATVIPAEYRPMSPWAYFGLSLLFSIPFIGFIFLLVFTFDKSNINRRNYVLSYWISAAISIGLFILILILAAILGFGMIDIIDEILLF